ncbi:MAG: dehydrogenase, partial [Kofleriaceae bacterium]
DADLVVHASGSSAGLQLALRIAGFESTIVELSWYGDRSISLPLGEAFHAKRLTLRSSQVGHVSPRQRARWDTRRRLRLALDLLRNPALEVLISGESSFDELPAAMLTLSSDGSDVLCHRIRYW